MMFKAPNAEEGRRFVTLIANSTQQQCREMGEMMISLASAPRDHRWQTQMAKALEDFPEPPASTIVTAMEQGRKRIEAHDRELWSTGWHPVQMRRELEARGYQGEQAATEPTATDLRRAALCD
ncbi:hypothetical protein ACFOKI_15865 [Sphingomonas qilianensis]|uniref:Uncharacterized protein n=1 Tax=Sphingomonas qilianensis TaxID=1736690 RepID=A0ABU9XWD0_9SPHN